MTLEAPFYPGYTSGQTVSPAAGAASISINGLSRQVCLTNLGTNVCYVRVSNKAVSATAADYPVPPGMQCIITKASGDSETVLPASVVEQARAAAALATPAGQGMWVVGLSPSGNAPATHYISSGLIDQVFADLLDKPTPDIAPLVAVSDVSADAPWDAMGRLGLKLVETLIS